jgi:hypothetical protein
MRARRSPHPFIVFVDSQDKRIEQIDLLAVDAPYYEAMVAAADVVQLYVDGALKMFTVGKITFSPCTGYTFVTVDPILPALPALALEAAPSSQMEGQMCIDDYSIVTLSGQDQGWVAESG